MQEPRLQSGLFVRRRWAYEKRYEDLWREKESDFSGKGHAL